MSAAVAKTPLSDLIVAAGFSALIAFWWAWHVVHVVAALQSGRAPAILDVAFAGFLWFMIPPPFRRDR